MVEFRTLSAEDDFVALGNTCQMIHHQYVDKEGRCGGEGGWLRPWSPVCLP